MLTAVAALLLLLATASAADAKRPRPDAAAGAQTAVAPNGFQLYNEYASPESTYASERVVVHYVVLGIDAPPLNDDDHDGVPDYVERVGEAADRSLTYYERRGFHAPLEDVGGPDSRPDLYISRFAPGTFGVALPAVNADGGAFAVIANNLDPSAERSLASLYGTVAHELFHLVQFSYFGRLARAGPSDVDPRGLGVRHRGPRVPGARRHRFLAPDAALVLGDSGEPDAAKLRRAAALEPPRP